MKRTVTLCLALLTVCLLCLTSCEQTTAYTQLRDYLEKKGPQQLQAPDEPYIGVSAVYEEDTICLAASAGSSSVQYGMLLYLEDCAGEYEFRYVELDAQTGSVLQTGSGTLKASSYVGTGWISFDEYNSVSGLFEVEARQMATQLLNGLLLDLDILCHSVHLSVSEFGFEVLDARYRVTETAASGGDDDMGGAFSAARLALSAQVLLIGMGMVFSVLAILWLVLIVFKKVMYDAPAKRAAKETSVPEAPADAPEETSAEEAPEAGDDGALVAAITAAIAATIASDEASSSQFAGGFRVVSFKKKSDRAPGAHWNQ